jgi:endonuclease/exonuclease/phosphatase (EEP) superfamily protein YafD
MNSRTDVRPLARVAIAATLVGGASAAAAALLGFAGSRWWLLDLLTHFRPVYGLVLLGAATLAFAVARPRAAAAMAAVLVVNTVPLVSAVPETVGRTDGVALRVLVSNVERTNPDHSAVAELIAAERPDLIALIEVDRTWLDALGPSLAGLDHAVDVPRSDCFGVALRSRWPLTDVEVVDDPGLQPPWIVATLAVEGAEPTTVVVAHPHPPVTRARAAARDAQLEAMGRRLAATTGPRLVVGDLNATPWSTPMARLLEQTGLEVAGGPLGPRGTWPSRLPLLRLPIDHVLHDPEVWVVRHELGPAVGSDHRPVAVDLRLPAVRDGV